jgi:hypothetical protein
MSRRLVLLLLGIAIAWHSPARAQPSILPLSAQQVKHRVQHRLDGFHFTAHIRMDIRKPGYEEHRDLVVWRDDQDGERERLMAQFESPQDMRGTGLLYTEGIDAPNNYFLYQPSTRRVRRIPESMVSQDVYGVDLEYMGFGVAQLQPVEVESMEIATLDGKRVYRLVEKALYENLQRFDRRIIWIDPDTFIPIQAEHRRNGKITMTAKTQKLEKIQGVPTPVETIYERPLEGVSAYMTVKHVDYESPIPEIFFSTLQLMKAR